MWTAEDREGNFTAVTIPAIKPQLLPTRPSGIFRGSVSERAESVDCDRFSR
jgi:hypothetical protein